ncbi:transcriptional regulator [Janibacter sp. Soil728]|uniref:MerR family transcriptional regulator n=1 Tax=Janibacter sp. Soil728 TaxID=1736393 RepID=UPI000701D194|nr:MerR family transcriptional regulator [Janibacter sp. Soil728]KRE39009.1 transcriptional regulator [Janibacter sp. Soil728]
MKISELSTATDVPVATLKYYLREDLLPAGEQLSRTSAAYGEEHVERVRLIRALTSVGGLSVATTRRVLEVITQPGAGRVDVLGAAQRALLGEDAVVVPPCVDREVPPSRARSWLTDMGWQVHPLDPVIDDLDAAWDACEAAGLGLDEERMTAYADGVLRIARADVDSVPQDPAAAVRQVVLGTVLVDPVLAPLRRLAQQHLTVGEGG